MAQPVAETAFSSGELSPSLYARVDLAKYHTGLKRCHNFFVDFRGGVSNRPGTRYVSLSVTPTSGPPPRLIPFEFSIVQTYILEFGHQYMRVIKDGGYVIEPPAAISAVYGSLIQTNGGFHEGDWVFINDTGSNLDGNTYYITDLNSGAFNIHDLLTGELVSADQPISSGVAGRVFTLPTPWNIADVRRLKYTQNADTMTIVHPSYTPYDLTRTEHWNWTLTPITFDRPLYQPSAIQGGASTTGSMSYGYIITAVDSHGNESAPSEMFQITHAVNMGATAGSMAIAWPVVTGAAYYNIYRTIGMLGDSIPAGSSVGFLGSTTGLSFNDTNILPDFSKAPALHFNPFAPSGIDSVTVTAPGSGIPVDAKVVVSDLTGFGARITPILNAGTLSTVVVEDPGQNYTAPVIALDGGSGYSMTAKLDPATGTYPGVVTYFQQRKVYASSYNQPSTFWMSKVGLYRNFDKSDPVKDDDAITGTLSSNQVNEVRSLLAMPSGLIVVTGGGAWQLSGGQQGQAITPKTLTAQPQSYTGISYLEPIVINYDILYVQNLGSTVRDLSYNFYANVYTGIDMTILSNHLFENRTITAWAYADIPWKIIWCVRDDGTMLSFTYLKEQEVYGWAAHTTDGAYKDIVTIPEDGENTPYMIVERNLKGKDVYVVEQMMSRKFQVLSSAWFVDCGLAYNGEATNSIRGLDHLEGKSVVVNGNGAALGPYTVTDGAITVPIPVTSAIIGLPYIAEAQTLSLETGQGTMQTKRKFSPAVTFRVQDTVGLSAGTSFDTLMQIKQEGYDVFTGDLRISLDLSWNVEDSICWRAWSPLPATVLGVFPEIMLGDT